MHPAGDSAYSFTRHSGVHADHGITAALVRVYGTLQAAKWSRSNFCLGKSLEASAGILKHYFTSLDTTEAMVA